MTNDACLNAVIEKDDPTDVFRLEEEIGNGGFGIVYKGVHIEKNQQIAIKKMPMPENNSHSYDTLLNEIEILKKCKHNNIAAFYGAYRSDDDIYITMELCNSSVRDIFTFSDDPLSEAEIALIARETLKGLEYLHDQNIIHRDIKGGNILLTEDGKVKLIDFGVSSMNAKKAKTFVGTPFWMAPELIQSRFGFSAYGPSVDVWALGITCIELAETVAPLSFIDPMRAIFQIVVKESPTLEDKDKWSENFHDFLSLCLERNPKKRPSSSDLLLHPFVRECDSDPNVLLKLIERRNKLVEEDLQKIALEENRDNEDDDEDPTTNTITEGNSSAPADLSMKLENDDDENYDLNKKKKKNKQVLMADTIIVNDNKNRKPQIAPTIIVTDKNNKNNNRENNSELIIPQRRKLSRQATLKTQTYTQRATPLNGDKKILKDQILELTEYYNFAQKKLKEQEKDHTKERDRLKFYYEDQLEKAVNTKNQNDVKNEKKIKALNEKLQKGVKDERKRLENEQINKDEIREILNRNSKDQSENEKRRKKEQSEQFKKAKRINTKLELKNMENEFKVEKLLSEKLFELSQIRVKLREENDFTLDQQIKLSDKKFSDLILQQKQEKENLDMILTCEIEFHSLRSNIKTEQLNELQKLEKTQLQSRHALQQQNTQSQFKTEREQQLKLLQSDHQKQIKAFRENANKLQAKNKQERKQLQKLYRSKPKSVLEKMQEDSLQIFISKMKMDEKEFFSMLEKQRIEEETQITEQHDRLKKSLVAKDLFECEEMEFTHSSQTLELIEEELSQRTELISNHHDQLCALVSKQHEAQSSVIQEVNEQKFSTVLSLQKMENELFTQQTKEVESFLLSKIGKLLAKQQKQFKDFLSNHINEEREILSLRHENQKQMIGKQLETTTKEIGETQHTEKLNLQNLMDVPKAALALELTQLQEKTNSKLTPRPASLLTMNSRNLLY